MKEQKDKKEKKRGRIFQPGEPVCEHCRTPIPGNLNLCPKCGLTPGPQTLTDIERPRKEK